MSGQIFNMLQAREMEQGPFSQNITPVSTEGVWVNWRVARDDDNIAWLLMDKTDTSTNVLSQDVLRELGEILKQLKNKKPKGLVLRSAKAGNFCVGADINEFTNIDDSTDLMANLKAAHAVADRLAKLPWPTIAVIHGTCFGGGLELALCCRYRLALPGAQLGLPEIQLGLHPGLGGTARLTHLINPIEAMTMMLTGKPVRHGKAKALGLVDAIVEERHLGKVVSAAMNGKIARHKQGWKGRLLNSRFARQKAAGKMREKAAAKAPPQHYPAPKALIALWEQHGGNSRKMRREEMKSFATLLPGETTQNLIRVFFLREKLKRLGRNGPGRNDNPAVNHVHVVGAGTMGGDIASWCALQGLRVSLYDPQSDMIAKAVNKARELCQHKHLSSGETRNLLDRLVPDFKNRGASQAQIVIEAVPEKIEIKEKVYAELEPLLKPGAILATNTSSIPLEKLRQSLKDPGRLLGLHFFNPVAQMQLIEIVQHDAVDSSALQLAHGFAGQISRLPVPVSSAPGFLVNRALTPYLLEAIMLLDQGMAAETIDRVALDFGMPMGPIELADQVGLDICLGVADMLRERLQGDIPQVPEWLRQKVKEDHLGRKSGEGLYTWEKNQPRKKGNPPAAKPDTLDRLILPMLNACMACLREGVIDDEDLLDGAMIFGTGFAPFRGGPMHYAHTRGFGNIVDTMNTLTEQYGTRFAPDAGWTAQL